MTKISVIVPVYNVEKYLKKCLNSLINQTFKEEYEIIVVNDGSPDNSQKIIDEYKEKHPSKIKSFIKENGGVSKARNYGISKAIGEYIAFVDSDDYVSANYLEIMYHKAVSEKCDLVVCDAYREIGEHREIFCGMNNKEKVTNKELLLSMPSSCNKIYKRCLFVSNNIIFPHDIGYGEDLATVAQVLLHATKIGYVDKPLYHYFVREGSVTNQDSFCKTHTTILKAFDKIIEYYKKNECFEEYKEELEYLAISHIVLGLSMNVYKYEEAYSIFKQINKYMQMNFPKWQKNRYLKDDNWKYRLVYYFISKNQVGLIRKIWK